MNAKATKQVMTETYLFDGSDETLYTTTFTLALSNGDQLNATAETLSAKRLIDSTHDIDPLLYAAILQQGKLQKSDMTENYVNLNRLSVDRLMRC